MLERAITYFTDEKKIMACLSVTCGDAGTETHAMRGCIDLDGTPVAEDSIYDLASLTKLFTGLTVMRLAQAGKLTLQRPATDYAPQFTQLGGITVDQLLGFEVGLVTPRRVDAQPDAASALKVLQAVRPVEIGNGRAYSDMHAMVLKYVIEGAAELPYMQVLQQEFLRPLGMTETFACVPRHLRSRCVSCDREHRIEGARWFVREGILPGTPHDPKAQLLQQGDDLCGHAGLFSTRGDMTRLCQALLRGDVLDRAVLTYMARNRTGRRIDGGWTQFLGSQCYVKHPDQYYSEIPVYMSDRAIGLSGFTGHHLSVDPETGVFALFLGNRVLNRLSVLVPEAGKTRMDYGLAPDGSGRVTWPDGTTVDSSVDYVHQKDARLHKPIADLLGLRPYRRAGSEWP